MPKYSKFYSATEAEAVASLLRLYPLQADAPYFSSDDAEALDSLTNGTLTTSSRPRNDVNQPLFRLKPNTQSFEELLLNASGFSITYEVVHRDKAVHDGSSYEDSAEEWKLRSPSPSSDEPSPRDCSVRTPIFAAASSDGSECDAAYLEKSTHMNQLCNLSTISERHVTYQHNVLQNMDTQFSKWTYNLNEGNTSIPFVVAHAPADTHESLVKIDREFWVTKDDSSGRETARYHSAAQAVRERAQSKVPMPLNSHEPKVASELKLSTNSSIARRVNPVSKRAALIAKSKTVKDNLLVVSTSANQRRSAMHRNKNRRSIMPSPPPTARRTEPAKKQEVQTEESRPTVLIVDRKENYQRSEVDSTLQNGSLDWNDDGTLEALMKRLGSTDTDVDQAAGEMVGALEKIEQDDRTQRLKGKARKKAKSAR